MRIGLFGGSFDPVHYGHLLLAEYARSAAGLDAVWFMPAATAPHKLHRQSAAAADRAEMLKLAIGGHEAFQVSHLEIDRGGVSYTVDTLRALRDAHAGHDWFLLMGADTLHDLSNWKSPADVCALASPLVVRRAGEASPDFSCLDGLADGAAINQFRSLEFEMPLIDISSTQIRARVAVGKSIRYQTPRAVEMYIATKGLYRS